MRKDDGARIAQLVIGNNFMGAQLVWKLEDDDNGTDRMGKLFVVDRGRDVRVCCGFTLVLSFVFVVGTHCT